MCDKADFIKIMVWDGFICDHVITYMRVQNIVEVQEITDEYENQATILHVNGKIIRVKESAQEVIGRIRSGLNW